MQYPVFNTMYLFDRMSHNIRHGRENIDHLCVFVTFQSLFGREADKLEHANDDERTYYIIEKEPLVNKFISVPKDKGSLNCSVFTAGII